MSQLIKVLPEPLKGRPTLERMLAFLKSSDFNHLTGNLHYLKEYELGLEIGYKLLRFVESHRDFNTQNPEHARVLVQLHSYKLDLLDKADKWEDYLRAVEELRKRPELQIGSQPTTEEAYWKLKDLLNGNYPKSYKAQVAEMVAELEQGEWASDSYGRRFVTCAPKHLVDSWGVKERVRVVQRKLARKGQGKTVDHLRHKQVWQLTEEEYQNRIEWLKRWREYCQQVDELINKATGSS